MRIDYVSSAMDTQDFTKLFEHSPRIPGQQSQKYNRLLMRGLAENGASVRAVTGRPITPENYGARYIPMENKNRGMLRFHYCSVLNIKGIKNIWQILTTFFAILFGNSDAVVADVLNASVAFGALLASKMRRKPLIGVVTDLPELMVTGNSKKRDKLVYRVIDGCSAYVVLTEALNIAVNPRHKPYTIIEALCDSVFQPEKDKKDENEPLICMYAGLLDSRYGVKDMVEGFILASIPHSELHVYGNGPYADELIKTSQQHTNVIYHGVVINEEVVCAERKADLLINPRPTSEEFTKYSFPSKNMEYMASGTPVLTTDLPGIPDEYKEFLFVLHDESTVGIAKALKEIASLPSREREERGKRAKRFVQNNKNNVQQSRKLLELIIKVKTTR